MMMVEPLAPELPDFARLAISWKEAALGTNRMNALHPTVEVWRKGQRLATITAPKGVIDLGFQAIHLARITLQIDRVVAAFDTYMRPEKKLPPPVRRSGESPQQAARRNARENEYRIPSGEIQRQFEDQYTREKYGVSESIIVIDARIGEIPVMAILPFLLVEGPPANRVVWHKEKFHVERLDEQSQTFGRIVDIIIEILKQEFPQSLLGVTR